MLDGLRNLSGAGVTLDDSFRYLAVYQHEDSPDDEPWKLRLVLAREGRKYNGHELALIHDELIEQWPKGGQYVVVAARSMSNLRDALTLDQELALQSEQDLTMRAAETPLERIGSSL